MLKTNQNSGLDYPGCAWGESPENGMVKFLLQWEREAQVNGGECDLRVDANPSSGTRHALVCPCAPGDVRLAQDPAPTPHP